jgi:type II secretory pathway pseudopilin PulG
MPTGSAPPRRLNVKQQHGFTMAAVLAAMLIVALSAQGVMTYVSQQAQRERELDLLRIGQAYAQAIGTFYESSPGNLKRWPRSLDDLVEDKRFVGVKRHLREIYADPITRLPDWGMVMSEDGGIAGVYSKADAKPIRSAPIELDAITLPAASRYADWQFVYRPAPPPAAVRR